MIKNAEKMFVVLFVVSASLAAEVAPRVVDRIAKDTITPIELDIGDTLNFKLRNGQVRKISLVSTEAHIVKYPEFSFSAKFDIDGTTYTITRYVPGQKSFYEPTVVNGVRIWLDAVSDMFKDDGGWMVNKDEPLPCKPKRKARLVVNDVTDRICPEKIIWWYPQSGEQINANECYDGNDVWLGPYGGNKAHGGLDVNMKNGTFLYAPINFDDQYYFNSLAKGDDNNRWRGVRRWPDGSVWRLQSHHLNKLFVAENQPLAKGTKYASTAGVKVGGIPHTHFAFRIFEQGEDYLIDPWIFFWQTIKDNSGQSARMKLPAIISDNMVLQADSNVPLWGSAEPQSKIIVNCSWDGANVATDANSEGKWLLKVKTPKNGNNCSITITCGQESRTISNILIGEVWLCSGQSNMWWPVKQANDANVEIAAADYPATRFFTVEQQTSDTPLNDCTGKWVLCNSENVADFSAVGYFFGRELYKKLNRPIGLIDSSYGGTPAQAWTSKAILANDERLKKYLEKDAEVQANKDKYQQQYDQALTEWQRVAAVAKAAGEKEPKKPAMPRELFQKNRPSVLYNAMIHPLMPFTIKGVIWYQGESNAGDTLYKDLFPAMIKNWRQDWGQGDFPFYYVQLASFGKYMKRDANRIPDMTIITDSNWAMIREAQFKALSLPNTGMASAIDIGDIGNIHPGNKQDVGKRLALWALAKCYGFEEITYSGPLYKNMKIEDEKIRICFESIGSGLIAKGNEIKGFTIAGADKKFYRANAEIQGDTVLVWSPEIKKPVSVRYGWSDWSNCNLYNKEWLPASPFRTDNW